MRLAYARIKISHLMIAATVVALSMAGIHWAGWDLREAFGKPRLSRVHG